MFGFMAYLIVIPPVILLLLNYVFQFGFIQFIQREADAAESCDLQTHAYLRMLSVAAYAGSLIKDLFETLDMLEWTRHITTEKSHTAYQVEIDEEGGKKRLASGITLLQKALFVVLVIVPKFVIGILLFFSGSRYVLFSATNSDLILNCVAMIFVLEIDGILYRAFTPSFAQKIIEDMPPVEVESFDKGVASLCLVPWVKAVLFALMLWFMLGHAATGCE